MPPDARIKTENAVEVTSNPGDRTCDQIFALHAPSRTREKTAKNVPNHAPNWTCKRMNSTGVSVIMFVPAGTNPASVNSHLMIFADVGIPMIKPTRNDAAMRPVLARRCCCNLDKCARFSSVSNPCSVIYNPPLKTWSHLLTIELMVPFEAEFFKVSGFPSPWGGASQRKIRCQPSSKVYKDSMALSWISV